MKKYNKPVLKSVMINSTLILNGSVGIKSSYATGQLSNERNNFFDEEEAPAW